MRAMNTTFEQFQQTALAEGFDEVLQRDWAPNTVLDTHTHPFGVRALVVAGQLCLSVDGAERELAVGDSFVLDANVPHAERYGPAGASYWVARRMA
jgi:quercetin dioxygenase-like cupin family protein